RRFEAFDQRARTNARKKFLLDGLERLAAAELCHKVFQAGGVSRPWKDGVDGDSCPTAILRQTTRNRELSGLRHAVVNHFLGSKNGALAANKNNSPPILLLHPRDISAAEPYAAEHIDLEDVAPILVGNCIKRLGLINSDV